MRVNGATQAIAIRVGRRYFYGYSQTGLVQTAWSLAGAKLFLHHDEAAMAVQRIQQRRKKVGVYEVLVQVIEPEPF